MMEISDSRGSIAPLGIGLFFFSISLVAIVTASSSMFIFQKRLTNLAETAALYVAETNQSVGDFIKLIEYSRSSNLKATSKYLSDGVTVEVTVCDDWSPLIGNYLDLSVTQICSHAAARLE